MTRSQAMQLPPIPPNLAAQIETGYALVEALETPTQAAQLATSANALRAAMRAANLGREAQNTAARLHLAAERRLGQLLAATVQQGARDTTRQLPEGITRARSSQAQKLASISDADWDSWIAHTLDAGKELSRAAALRIAPLAKREERKSLADAYSAPPIDVSIARAWGLDASDERADLLVTSITTGLAMLAQQNNRHAYVWARYHGINDDGSEGDAWTFEAIAQINGWSRPYVENLYYRASHHMRGQIAVDALAALASWGINPADPAN